MMLQGAVSGHQRDVGLILQNIESNLGVRLHMPEFFIVQHPRLLDNFDRNLGFANVMKQGAETECLKLVSAVAVCDAENKGVQTHIQRMNVQIIVCGMHVMKHNHGIFLKGHVVQDCVHDFGEFFVQMVEPFGNA
ncbi:hypothetical protein D3C71_1281480 [compost metagenome]